MASMALHRRTLKWARPFRDALLSQTQANSSSQASQRELSKQAGHPRFGIVFDIDGVLLRGGKPIGGASQALQQLYENPTDAARLRVPYVFLTNGGGITEAAKAAELSRQLGVPISPDQVTGGWKHEWSEGLINQPLKTPKSEVLLGHTPFKTLVDRFVQKRVLAVGKGEPDVVMKTYGFQQVIHMDSYINEFDNIDHLARYKPWVQPLPTNNNRNVPHSNNGQVAAVFVVSDPVDWGRDLQVICDVLRSDGHPSRGTGGSQTPIYLAADDLEFQSTFPVPRLGMGAFRIALESIYNQLPVAPLIYRTFGKPQVSVYKDAEDVLKQIQNRMLRTPSALSKELMHGLSFPPPPRIDPPILTPLKTIYMIGDNPASDIKGAKSAGEPWFSILTKTGCYRGNFLNTTVSPDKVVEDVEEAIRFISAREGLQEL